MSQQQKLMILVAFGLACVMGFAFASADEEPIQVTTRSFIRAGDALSIRVQVNEAVAGDTVDITLANGLNFIDDVLILGTGGVAVWNIESKVITQAGTSLLIVQYNDWVVRQSLRVLPLHTDHINVFANVNNIVAYGEDSTTIIILPEDRWGNTSRNADKFDVQIIYPDTSRVTDDFRRLGGIGLYELVSKGSPGRVRITAESDDVTSLLELMQIPATADKIDLSISPTCVLSDGRDIMTILMDVTDRYNEAVTDGTLLTVRWDDGMGFARTIDGFATIHLPALDIVGEYQFTAQVRDVVSSDATLRVVEESCLE
jgi:hypothetical protein